MLWDLRDGSIDEKGWVGVDCYMASDLDAFFLCRFLVCENKTFAGREEKLAGDAIGRPLSVVWFERDRGLDQGMHVP